MAPRRGRSGISRIGQSGTGYDDPHSQLVTWSSSGMGLNRSAAARHRSATETQRVRVHARHIPTASASRHVRVTGQPPLNVRF